MKPKRVVIGHSWSDVSLNIQTKQVAYKLAQNSDVLYISQSRLKGALPLNDNLNLMEWPHKRPTALKDYLFAFKKVRTFKPDIIIVHFASTKALIFAGWLLGVKYRVAWYHTLYEQTRLEARNKFNAWIEVWIRTFTLKMATHVITQTKFASNDAMLHQKVNKNKLYTIQNGVSTLFEKPNNYCYNKERIDFLFVGRLTYSKGCDIIIDAFERLIKNNKNVYLHMIGAGEAESFLQKKIAEKTLVENIILVGLLTNYSDVYNYMSSAYALLVPSRIDNYPTVVIEAMSCGLPVIAANVGGIPDMIEDEIDGLLCRNEKDWAEKCLYLINNKDKRNDMALNARMSYENKFTVEKHVEKVMSFIEQLN